MKSELITGGSGVGLHPDVAHTETFGKFRDALLNLISVTWGSDPDDFGQVIAGMISDENVWINAQSVEIAGGYQI